MLKSCINFKEQWKHARRCSYSACFLLSINSQETIFNSLCTTRPFLEWAFEWNYENNNKKQIQYDCLKKSLDIES